jgi:hypothetical protein
MANTFTLIASSTVGAGGAASIDFTSIPSTYTDLVLKVSARDGDSNWVLNMKFNGTNGSSRYLQGEGASASSGTQSNMRFIVDSAGGTANTFGNAEIYIPNYTSSNYKSVSIDSVSEANATIEYMRMVAALWSSTSAINQITLLDVVSGNIPQYSTAYLYGVKNA